MNEKKARVENPQPSLFVSSIIILFIIFCFVGQLILQNMTRDSANPIEMDFHMTITIAAVFAVIVLLTRGVTLAKIEEGVIHGCKIATISMMILMFIGVMIPAWIGAGTIPTLIYYGLQIISPSVFLVTAMIICSISCLCTGTSWGTAGTFGVAIMGIGAGLGVPPAMTAGAVISGVMFGDKLSPVSDTVNLSAGTCEVNIFKHMKSVAYTTIPGYIIAIVVAVVMGIRFAGGNFDKDQVDAILDTINTNFNVAPGYAILSLVPLVIVITMAVKKVSALATIVASAISAMLIAVCIQHYNVFEMMSFMNYGFVIDSGLEDVDILMNRGGLQSMMWTVSLGYLGLSYGGILEKTGVLNTLLYSAQAITKNARNLILTHMMAGFATIMLSASPYVSILIPGRMFVDGYKKLGIDKTVCSRTCENSGICLDPLLPWTLGGVYYTGALGVSPVEYAPYAVLCWVVPIIAAFYAITGLFVWKETDPDVLAEGEAPVQ